MITRRRLIILIIVLLVILLALPGPIAERFTSPTQDGQYLLNPSKAYRFILTLARVGGSASLGNSGKALLRAKTVFQPDEAPPVKVELLYLSEPGPYRYLSRSGRQLTINDPPRLVWEVWGAGPELDVIGFLDFESGERLGYVDPLAGP